MRSVIRNPPTTFMVEQVTAIKANILVTKLKFSPSTAIEPINAMPEMAFVAAMSGVCSNGGIREMSWNPRKPAKIKMYISTIPIPFGIMTS